MALTERPGADDLLDLATARLRQHTDEGWVAVGPRVLAAALGALRPSQPVRGRHAEGAFTVTADVLRTSLRTVLDPDPRVRVRRLAFRTGADDALDEAVVELSVGYLQPIAPLAADVRRTVADHLRAVLGDPDLPEAAVTVDLLVTDVHRT
ncbi:MAG: hypothetical protein IR158_13410 [Cellulomonas sp.]|jgi:hypothetical protein|uniref:hypothetical protein n=1 Tax=Cellulomonas sp. TaxID=40001 RepID=UPI0019E18F8A|nr:hypothetical protein [Cellulomonas sp.]MBF0688749.1 hypothetical protein [Cellulomonas sp.]